MLEKSMLPRFIKIKNGFLLLELMVAFFIITLMASAASVWYVSTLHAQRVSFLRLKALLLARSVIEYSKTYGMPNKKELSLFFKPDKCFKVICSQKLLDNLGDYNTKNRIEKCTVCISYILRQKTYTVSLETLIINKGAT